MTTLFLTCVRYYRNCFIRFVVMQISTNVQQTTEVVALMHAALTLKVASRVPVYLGTPEMDSHVPVNESVAVSFAGSY